uniref:5-oxoprolinase n=1 Tax=Romanomermis culicivorax TaxID=13658 RepID=A0A915IBY4_ROMCU
MPKFSFAIDRGGTFTDIYVRRPDGTSRILKLLSEDKHYVDAPTEGIRRILEDELKIQLPRSQPIDASQIESIRMGTTVATNALLERKGQRVALAITKGFKDLLYIGNQSRPNLFELNISKPGVLYDEIVEVDERVILKIENCQMNLLKDEKIRRGQTTTGDTVFIWKAVDDGALVKDLRRIIEKGITSLAVLLIHSYKFPQHEIIVENLAKKLGFKNISLSSKIMPMIKAVPRGFTTTADAYLTPVIQKYVTAFTSGFKNLDYKKLLFMQSDGGLAPIDSFFGSKAILSGPAGGVVGVALTAYDEDSGRPVIGYDMGGTSTDVSRYGGRFEHVFEATTANIIIQAPQRSLKPIRHKINKLPDGINDIVID